MKFKVIWKEEFTSEHLDLNHWAIETGGHGFGNKEAQCYTERLKNIRIENNQLVIEAHKEDYEGCGYTSGKITTYGHHHLQYGKIVVRAHIPKGLGTWPAIWMLPTSFMEGAPWPKCGEIDIMEHVGRNLDDLYFSLHTERYNHRKNTQITHIEATAGITERFADYGMIWTHDQIIFTVDEQVIVTFNKEADGQVTDPSGWPFDQPFYLILNLAIGGYFGGAIDDALFPVRFVIDSVKIYDLVSK